MPITYTVVVLCSMLIYKLTGRFSQFRVIQLVAISVLPAAIHIIIGSVVESGAVILWSILGPVAGLFFFERVKPALGLLLLYLGIVCGSFMADFFSDKPPVFSFLARTLWFLANLLAVSGCIFLTVFFFVKQLQQERGVADSLLQAIFPVAIANRLKSGDQFIAERYENTSVVFVDIAEFTAWSRDQDPMTVVNALNMVFTAFDSLAETYGLEKIKTIGGRCQRRDRTYEKERRDRRVQGGRESDYGIVSHIP